MLNFSILVNIVNIVIKIVGLRSQNQFLGSVLVLDEKVLTFWRHVLFFSHADDLFKAIFCYKYEIKLYVFDGAKSIPGIDGTFWQKDFGPLRPCWLPYPNQLFYIVNILYCQYFILSIFYIVNILYCQYLHQNTYF